MSAVWKLILLTVAVTTTAAGCWQAGTEPLPGIGRAPDSTAEELPAAAKPSEVTVDKLEILELLRQNEFESLEETLRELAATAHDHPTRSLDFELAIEALAIGEAWMTPHVEAWVGRRAESAWAHAVSALHHEALGWRSRGGKVIQETRSDQLEGQRSAHTLAIRAARKALELDDRLIEPYVIQMRIARSVGGLATCEAIANDALDLEPANFRVWHAMMTCALPRWGGSHREMDRIARRAQRSVDDNPRLRGLLGCADSDRADIARRSEDYERALELDNRSLEHGELAHFYMSRSFVYSHTRRHEEALEDRTRALELEPQNARRLMWRAYTLASLGRFPEMREDLELAAKLEPTDVRVLEAQQAKLARRAITKAFNLYKEGKNDEAISLYLDILSEDPSYAEGYYYLAFAYKKSAPDRAQSYFEKAIELDPRHFEAHEQLHGLLQKKGQWSRLRRMWDAYLLIQPEKAEAYYKRYMARRRLEKIDEAQEDLEKACGFGYERACEALARVTSADSATSGASPGEISELRLVGTFKTPQSSKSPPALYSDLMFDSEKMSFIACADGSQGEFQLEDGEIDFSPPAFVAPTGEFIIRGFAKVPGIGMCAAENKQKFVFLGRTRADLPPGIKDVVGLAYDGKNLLVADAGNNLVHKLVVTRDNELRPDGSFAHGPSERLAGITWDGKRLWTADKNSVYALNPDGSVAWVLPVPGVEISGITFADGFLFATGYREKVIYKFKLARE